MAYVPLTRQANLPMCFRSQFVIFLGYAPTSFALVPWGDVGKTACQRDINSSVLPTRLPKEQDGAHSGTQIRRAVYIGRWGYGLSLKNLATGPGLRRDLPPNPSAQLLQRLQRSRPPGS